MRILPIALLAGAAAVACAGVAAMAESPAAQTHVLTVQLPDGSSEQIRYSGDVAPQVVLSPGSAEIAALPPPIGGRPADASAPFDMLERMSAEMNRQMADLMAGARAMPPPSPVGPGGLQRAEVAKLPPGAQSFSVVSSFSGGHACTRSVEVTSQGPNQPPRVVSHTSGDCAGEPGPVSHAPAAIAAPDEARPHAPGKVV